MLGRIFHMPVPTLHLCPMPCRGGSWAMPPPVLFALQLENVLLQECQPSFSEMAEKQHSAALNSLMALTYFKCISPFRISALCQWDVAGLLLSLKCGNLSSHLLDELHVRCSKCSLISPSDCLLSVVYLIP